MTIYPMLAYWRGGHGGFAPFWLIVLLCFAAACIGLLVSRERPKDRNQREVAELRREVERLKSPPPKT
jgi:Na+-transporting methylmalonyl-CoA/oxaloacetate decarboxylase gamma subunit